MTIEIQISYDDLSEETREKIKKIEEETGKKVVLVYPTGKVLDKLEDEIEFPRIPDWTCSSTGAKIIVPETKTFRTKPVDGTTVFCKK